MRLFHKAKNIDHLSIKSKLKGKGYGSEYYAAHWQRSQSRLLNLSTLLAQLWLHVFLIWLYVYGVNTLIFCLWSSAMVAPDPLPVWGLPRRRAKRTKIVILDELILPRSHYRGFSEWRPRRKLVEERSKGRVGHRGRHVQRLCALLFPLLGVYPQNPSLVSN